MILTQIVNKAAKGEARFMSLLLEYATAIDRRLERAPRLSPKAMELRIRKALLLGE